MADENQLENEVLDFEDDALPELPDENPFDADGSKKPWLLIGVGVVAVTLVIVLILKLTTGGGRIDTGVIEIPIETVVIEEMDDDDDFVEGAGRLVSGDAPPVGMPERVVEQRRDVTFDPDKPVVARPRPRPAPAPSPAAAPAQAPARAAAPAPAPRPTPQPQTAAARGTWSVQFGAYNTRAAAESAQSRLQNSHRNLFTNRDFAILAAVVADGTTKYRLRVVGFQTSGEANNFCRGARNDGIQDCFATR